MNQFITFHNIHKSFGSQSVLRGASFSIPKGKITFIIGKSGEGKSVILKHIAGILKQDSGTVILEDKDTSTYSDQDWREVRKKMGYLFQDGALFASMTVFENVAFPAIEEERFSSSMIKERVKIYLEKVGLQEKENSKVTELSIGEKKRVGFARALIVEPELLLYDEPTTSMDTLISLKIDSLIKEIHTEKITSIVVSHDLSSIFSIADHILFLNQGVIHFQGSPEALKHSTDKILRQFIQNQT